jgi:uncharacterized alpha-E superfamily protein
MADLNQLDQQFSTLFGRDHAGSARHRPLESRHHHLSAFAGLVMEGMTRGDGWRFSTSDGAWSGAADGGFAALQPGR